MPVEWSPHALDNPPMSLAQADWADWLTQWYVLLPLGVVLLLYVVAPLIIRGALPLNAHARVEPLAPAYLTPAAWRYFQSTAPGFAIHGFRALLYARLDDQVPNVSMELALWVNERAGQQAMAARVNTGAEYVEFCTVFADGSSLITTTTGDVGVFKRFKEKDTLSVPGIRDVGELYRLHLYRETLATPRDPIRYVPADHDAVDYLRQSALVDMLRQQRGGYYFQTEQPGLFRMTIFGAFLITWKLLPPWNQLRKLAARRRAKGQLRGAGARPVGPPRNARISRVSPYESMIRSGTV
jgi:hypothetical protein